MRAAARHLLRAWPAGVGAVLLTVLLFLGQSVEIREMQDKAYDFHMRAQGARDRAEVVIVRIDDADYRDLFARRSPLDPDVLQRILDAVALGAPRVIGVDIETADSQFIRLAPPPGVPVVWAAGTCPMDDANDPQGSDLCPARPGREERESYGLAALRPASDWTIRRFARCVRIGDATMPLFSTAVLAAAGTAPDACDIRASHTNGATQERMIRFRRVPRRFDIPASDVLRLAHSPGFQRDGPLANRIVLLGGSYREARDFHMTPLGPMAGVDVWAQIIETDLEGGGLVPPKWYTLLLVQLVAGTTLILIFLERALPRAVAWSLAATPLLAVGASLITFGTLWHVFYFLPILGLILLWSVVDRANEYRRAIISEMYRSTRATVRAPARPVIKRPVIDAALLLRSGAAWLRRLRRLWAVKWRRVVDPAPPAPPGPPDTS